MLRSGFSGDRASWLMVQRQGGGNTVNAPTHVPSGDRVENTRQRLRLQICVGELSKSDWLVDLANG